MFNIAAVLLVIASGCALCGVLRVSIVYKEVWIAAIIAGLSAEISLVPLFFARNGDQAAVSQASLIATVLHLLLCAGAGLAVSSAIHASHAFLYWLCAFYWATIAAVATIAVRAVKAAPVPR
jgi:hypothetical protein